jgi:hypothetical protein
MTENTVVTLRQCAHVRADGSFCRSAAMRQDRFCYFHRRDRARRENLRQARQSKLSFGRNTVEYLDDEILESFDFPVLEDANAIQVCLTILLRAIASGHVPNRRAGQLLYTLQLATHNLKSVSLTAAPEEKPLVDSDPEPIDPLIPDWLRNATRLTAAERSHGADYIEKPVEAEKEVS